MNFVGLGALLLGAAAACTPLIGLNHEYSVQQAGSGGEVSGAAGAGLGGALSTAGVAGAEAGGSVGGVAGASATAGAGGAADALIPKDLPPGKLVYHRYTTYNTSDSQMFIVDFSSMQTSAELGAAYGICDPMAGIFSPDGNQLAVTARPKPTGMPCPVGMNRNDLEVYLLDLTLLEKVPPVPLVPLRVTNNTVPDEDPQFAPTSNFLLLKHDGHLARWTLGSPPLTTCSMPAVGTFCYKSTGSEESKPVMSPDETRICYYEKSEADSDVFCFDAAQGAAGADIFTNSIPVAAHDHISEARPTISGNWIYYARWLSQAEQVDRVYRKPITAPEGPEYSAQFQLDPTEDIYDFTDPSVMDGDLLIITSDAHGAGRHDLFVANFNGKAVEPLDTWLPKINTSLDELGPSFWHRP